jgi:hypothetical protein
MSDLQVHALDREIDDGLEAWVQNPASVLSSEIVVEALVSRVQRASRFEWRRENHKYLRSIHSQLPSRWVYGG